MPRSPWRRSARPARSTRGPVEQLGGDRGADWTTPLPAGALTGRVLPGAGCIDLAGLWACVDAAGYTGSVEVEVFNEELWARDGSDILAQTITAYRQCSPTP